MMKTEMHWGGVGAGAGIFRAFLASAGLVMKADITLLSYHRLVHNTWISHCCALHTANVYCLCIYHLHPDSKNIWPTQGAETAECFIALWRYLDIITLGMMESSKILQATKGYTGSAVKVQHLGQEFCEIKFQPTRRPHAKSLILSCLLKVATEALMWCKKKKWSFYHP